MHLLYFIPSPIYLNVFSEIWSELKQLFDLWAEFFSNIGDLLSFLWNTIKDWYKFAHVLTTAVQYLPEVFDFLPSILIPFASATIVLSLILFLLGRIK